MAGKIVEWEKSLDGDVAAERWHMADPLHNDLRERCGRDAAGPMTHTTIENLLAISTGLNEHRVVAVEFGEHDEVTCDGAHLEVRTDDWIDCPVSGCRWRFDPETTCPVHRSLPS